MHRFDWRWVGVVALIIFITQIRYMPPVFAAVFLAAGGGYFIYVGWQQWRRGGGTGLAPTSSKKVTYWRGQRIELAPERRGPRAPSLRSAAPAVLFMLLGAALVLIALFSGVGALGVL
ncbi:hypothetical protein F8S13_14430 [Chloroflexia bacterium SDU3-3]|nr:hypothetical protein F8S13_14430 [Chloroflexia bacterium SDU3-3]